MTYPKEGSDFWRADGTIELNPGGGSGRAAQDALMDKIENMIRGTLDEATVNAMQNRSAAAKVVEATERLLDAKVQERESLTSKQK